MFCKKSVPRNFAKFPGKDLCQSLFFNKVFEKETLAQVFYCEFCEISKNTFFTEHLRWLLLWFMLVPSIVATWVSWFNGYRFKLEAEGFIFHILQRNFQFCVQQKSSGFLFFLILFSATCSKYGVFQSLVITFPKRILFFLFLFTSGIKLFKLIDTTRRAFRFFEFFLQIKLL